MYKSTYIHNALVSENPFRQRQYQAENLPDFKKIKSLLPSISWEGHEDYVACYNRAWEIAFSNLYQPTEESGFVSNFIDTAYNGNIFMWDSAFIMMFGLYGRRAFNFQGTLDNFYAKQHPDGFICREIKAKNGEDQFHRYDLVSTGPNLLPWAEWVYFEQTKDFSRLEAVFPVLVAYHQWLKHNRTWKDGSYFASGWATGMDNQPRLERGYHWNFSHGHMSWLDMNLQQILSGKILMKMGEVIERWQEIEEIIDETEYLENYVNQYMYDTKSHFYYDRLKDGSLSDVKSIGAYWGLVSESFSHDRANKLCDYLEDPKVFNRPHRIPSLSYDHPKYQEYGRYWQGGVWAPTNYMVLKGLEKYNKQKLAFDIAKNHLDNVVSIYKKTGTLWENYAPEYIAPAKPAKPDFVGWSGIIPIAVLLENVFGIQPDAPNNTIHWHIQLDNDRFSVDNYPFAFDNTLTLTCNSKKLVEDFPEVELRSKKPLTVKLYYQGKEKVIESKCV